jgi:hypothetical protein
VLLTELAFCGKDPRATTYGDRRPLRLLHPPPDWNMFISSTCCFILRYGFVKLLGHRLILILQHYSTAWHFRTVYDYSNYRRRRLWIIRLHFTRSKGKTFFFAEIYGNDRLHKTHSIICVHPHRASKVTNNWLPSITVRPATHLQNPPNKLSPTLPGLLCPR